MKRLLVVPVVAAALTLSLSACGGDSKDDGGGKVSPSGGGTITGNGGGAPTGNGGGGTNGGGGGGTNGGGGGSELTATQREALAKVVACMRKKGYGMPEPTSPVVVPTDKNGKSDAQVNKDSAECATQSQPSGG